MKSRKLTTEVLFRQYNELNPRLKLELFSRNPCTNIPWVNRNNTIKKSIVCWCDSAILLRRAKIDKNGRSYADKSSYWYCSIDLVNKWNDYQEVPFADSEMYSLTKLLELICALGIKLPIFSIRRIIQRDLFAESVNNSIIVQEAIVQQ